MVYVMRWRHALCTRLTRLKQANTPPPPLQTPKWLYRTMGFVGAGDFVLAYGRGEFFCLTLCVYTQNTQILWRIQKWMKNTKKDFFLTATRLRVGPWLMGA